MTHHLFNKQGLARLASLITPWLLVGTLATSLAMPADSQAADGAAQLANTQTRVVADFQGLELLTSADVSVRPGATQSVQVHAEERLQSLLETVVENRSGTPTLVVRWKPGTRIVGLSKVRLDLVVNTLQAVKVSGSGDVSLYGLSAPSMQLGVAGSGDITAQSLNTDKLHVWVAGSGDVRVEGSAKSLSVSVAGSGDVRLAEFRADQAQVNIAGSGDVTLQAHRTLDVNILGSGDVVYSGDAKLSRTVMGSGSIRQR